MPDLIHFTNSVTLSGVVTNWEQAKTQFVQQVV